MGIRSLPAEQFVATILERAGGEFLLLLGAGASRSSGIWTTSEIISDLLRDIYIRENNKPKVLKDKLNEEAVSAWLGGQSWYQDRGDESEYSAVINKAFLAEQHRREYIQQLIDRGKPSLGYQVLALLLNSGRFARVVTPNFDNLVFEASNILGLARITVIDSNQAIRSASFRDLRPHVYKLHGDFKYNNLKHTDEQTRSLDKIIRTRFRELLREHGCIALGYSGRDVSIMSEVLQPLAQDKDFLQKGFFWCHRPGSGLSGLAKEFLEACPNAWTVEVPDFDTFMQELGEKEGISSPPDRLNQAPIPVLVHTNQQTEQPPPITLSDSDLIFESSPVSGGSLEDIEVDLVKTEALRADVTLPAFSPAYLDDFMIRTGIGTMEQQQLLPTQGGLLLFGKQPAQRLKHAYIKAAVFHSDDRIESADITGRIQDQIRESLNYVSSHTSSRTIVGTTSQKVEEYPLQAVREALVNAVAHRDYSLKGIPIHVYLETERLVVSSPGGLIRGVRAQLLGRARTNRGSRNQTLMFFLRRMGFVEELGTGLIRIYREMRRNGSPDPIINVLPESFEVILPKRSLPTSETAPTASAKTPRPKTDLTINAFKAAMTPHRVSRVGTFHRDQKKVKRILWDRKLGFGHLYQGYLYFIGNAVGITREFGMSLKGSVEQVTIDSHNIETLGNVLMSIFNQALYSHLGHTLGLNRYQGKSFFVTPKPATPFTVKFRADGRSRHRKVVSRWSPTAWLNQAIGCKIERTQGDYYMILNPDLVMTSDGIQPEAPSQQRKINRVLSKRYNLDYKSWMSFWYAFLSHKKGKIVIPVDPSDPATGALIFERSSITIPLSPL